MDVHIEELIMRAQDQEVTFSVFDSMKYPAESEECSVLRIVDEFFLDALS